MLKVVSFLCVVSAICFTGVAPGQTLRPVRTFRIDRGPDSTRVVERSAGKDPRKAFLFSALFPGAGELYAGKKRGLAFSALEIGGITAYIMLNRTGNSRKRTVYRFADAHWDSTRCSPECTDSSIGSEVLGEYGSQQYYEQIGKYNKFQHGWDDYDPSSSALSPNRRAYVGMRQDMNRMYKWATYSTGFLLLNHVFSAIDAALAARQDREASDPPSHESRLRLQIDGDPLSPRVMLSFSLVTHVTQ